ncbi:MAG: aminotransferase class III-fold pyridoxal phosphate-dependent enzyme [Syntrophomonadaceae bacterium]|nr:aminotransferase class III-fold pyridoxal phosphate-dependent enzyme [Syntrophomonadaceae bacterium]
MPALRKDLLNPTLINILESFGLDKNYVKGEGSYLTDDKGIRYLDFISQYGAVPFGYNPEFIWEALSSARERKLPSLVQPSLPGEALRLANMLAQCSPGELCYATFCQSGTEAVEAALKLARSTTGREIIISTHNSFHGKTLGSLSATGKPSYQTPFRAPAPGFIKIPYNDAASLRQVLEDHHDEVAAFILELVQGEGGVVMGKSDYLREAQQICREFGVLFIVDEIQTGLGRTGRLFACEHVGLEPDILTLAKALGGGLVPLGVCLSSPAAWNEDFGMLHSSTFANNNVTCAVGIAVLEWLCANEQSLIKEIAVKGEYILEKARALGRNYPTVVKEVRGQGLLVGVEFHSLQDVGSYDMAFMEEQGGFTALLAGFLLNVYQIRLAPFLNNSMTLRLEPNLIITHEEIEHVMEALEVICQLLNYRDYASLYRYLIDDARKPGIFNDFRPASRRIKSSQLQPGEKPARKFAFDIHYPAPEDVVINNPSFAAYTRDELYKLMEWESKTNVPGLTCTMPALRSLDGTVAEGWLIGVPMGAREIMGLPNRDVVDVIARAVDMGRDMGAEIVGLGALTSVVTKGGRAVTGRDVAITSGNSFTTLMAIEALFLGAEKMNIEPVAARAGIVGANGSIGRACAMMVSEKVCRMILFGSPQHPTSSRLRLNSLARDIFIYARTRMREGVLEGMSLWLHRILEILGNQTVDEARRWAHLITAEKELTLDMIQQVCGYLGIGEPIKTSTDIAFDLPDCDLIVAASNSPDYLIYADNLRSGVVVCDVARPADVAPEVYEKRDDVLILEGGLVQYPDDICFGANLGYRDGVNLACLSETVLLALEGDSRDHSIGNILSLETIQYLRGLARKHGFSLAGLRMGNHEIDDRDIERIYRNSLHFKQAENM